MNDPYTPDNPAYPVATFRDYIRVLFRHKWVIVICVATVLLTVFFGLKLKTSYFQSGAKMLITAQKMVESPYYRDLGGYQNVERSLTQSEIVKSNPVIQRAVKALNLEVRPLDYEKDYADAFKFKLIDYQIRKLKEKFSKLTPRQQEFFRMRMAISDLKERTQVEPIRDTDMFIISVKDYDPVFAMLTANVVARSYVIFDLQQQLAELTLKYGEKHTTVSQLRGYIEKMEENLNGEPLDDIDAIGPASVKIIEQASIPFRPTGSPKALTMVLALFMSLFLGAMLAFVFEYMDQTFKNPQDIEQHLNLPVLGSIPLRQITDRTIVRNTRRKSVYTHFYQNLADQLYLVLKDKKFGSALFTSTEKDEGADRIIANLGVFLAHSGHKVLLIDANLRRPSLHRLFRMKPNKGLADVLEGKAPIGGVIHQAAENLHLVMAGGTELNPIILLDTGIVEEIIKETAEKYEVVLFICPGLKGNRDAFVLASHVDTTVLVVKEGCARRQVARAATINLEQKGVNVLGAVLSDRTFPIPKFVYERV